MDGGAAELGELERHFWLTRSVARVMGVNLSRAISEGQLTAQSYGAMISRCRGAGCDRRCELWLARQARQAESAPEFCAISGPLDRLRGMR